MKNKINKMFQHRNQEDSYILNKNTLKHGKINPNLGNKGPHMPLFLQGAIGSIGPTRSQGAIGDIGPTRPYILEHNNTEEPKKWVRELGTALIKSHEVRIGGQLVENVIECEFDTENMRNEHDDKINDPSNNDILTIKPTKYELYGMI